MHSLAWGWGGVGPGTRRVCTCCSREGCAPCGCRDRSEQGEVEQKRSRSDAASPTTVACVSDTPVQSSRLIDLVWGDSPDGADDDDFDDVGGGGDDDDGGGGGGQL